LTILIEDGKRSLGNKDRVSIDVNPALDILDDIRTIYPVEVEQSRRIIRQENEIIDAAEAEATRIVEDARNQALIIASEQEIVRIAQQQAETILADARDAEMEIRSGAEEYADQVFSHIENTVDQVGENVRRNRERLNSKALH
jgi:cell division septum initiation protein DivIVA